jgi:hypothetical protein
MNLPNGGHEFRGVGVPYPTTADLRNNETKARADRAKSEKAPSLDSFLKGLGRSEEMFDVKILSPKRDSVYGLAHYLYANLKSEQEFNAAHRPTNPMRSTEEKRAGMERELSSRMQNISDYSSKLGGDFLSRWGEGNQFGTITSFIQQELATVFTPHATLVSSDMVANLPGNAILVSKDLNDSFELSLSPDALTELGLTAFLISDSSCNCTVTGLDGSELSRTIVRFYKGTGHPEDGSGDGQFGRSFAAYLDTAVADTLIPGNIILTFTVAINRDNEENGQYLTGMPFDLIKGDMIILGSTDKLNDCALEALCRTSYSNTFVAMCQRAHQALGCIYTGDCSVDEWYRDYEYGESRAEKAVRDSLESITAFKQAIILGQVYEYNLNTDAGHKYNISRATNQVVYQNNIRIPNGTKSILNAIETLAHRGGEIVIDETALSRPRSVQDLMEQSAILIRQSIGNPFDSNGIVIAGAVEKVALINDYINNAAYYAIGKTTPNTMEESMKMYNQGVTAGSSNPTNILGMMLTGDMKGSMGGNGIAVADHHIDSHFGNIDTIYGFHPSEVKRLIPDYSTIIRNADFLNNKLHMMGVKNSSNVDQGMYNPFNFQKDATKANLTIHHNLQLGIHGGRAMIGANGIQIQPEWTTMHNEPLKLVASMEVGQAYTARFIENAFKVKFRLKKLGGFGTIGTSTIPQVGMPLYQIVGLSEGNSEFSQRVARTENPILRNTRYQ